MLPGAALLVAFAAPSSAQPLPWALVHGGKTVQRFVDADDNAHACSIARAAPERRSQPDAWRCRVDLPPAIEHDTRAPALSGPRVGVTVVQHSRGIHPVHYPPGSPMDGVDRSTTLEVHLAADGSVERVEVTRSSGDPRMDAAATDAARRWVYRPATVGGRPVPTSVSFPVDFPGVSRTRF